MKMRGVLLPGGRRVEIKEFDVPEPGHGQVLLKMKASSICGSDIRAIYREHLGHGPEGYQGVISGHEPCGQIVQVGPGCKRFKTGDRVILYHISGCGVCNDCREGYMISCTSEHRAAYGWQRDGGHADYLLAEEDTCVALPDELSYVDGALVACGFGTVYEALNRVDFDVSQTIIHNQITIYGSWVTSLGHMEDLVEKLVEWNLKPEIIVSHRFTLDQADEAYKVADAGLSGKVCIVMD